MRQAPSMTGLRELEAVVRCRSLSAAASELCVTPAAISHRLRSLEARGGSALVYRVVEALLRKCCEGFSLRIQSVR
jgi:LysR family glycine cleavage system transcriptional activator